MSRTVTALYDTREEAEAARARLAAAVNVEGKARIIDKSSMSSNDRNGLHGVPLTHEDRHAFGEGLRRGGFMLCAEVGGHEDTDRIVAILEETSSVDLDDRQKTWRSEGWTPYDASSSGVSSSGSALSGAQAMPRASASTGQAGASTGQSGNVVEEQRIPIVEEQLVVGKREINRGGARVRTYVREVPVHEQVTLREEHVSIERQPVSETVSSAELNRSDMFQERSIEMTETAEEAVVAKQAKVREELVVRKTTEEHVENIDDTVRRTEVEVDEGTAGSSDRSAFGSFGAGNKGAGTTDRGTSDSDYERTKVEGTDRDKRF